MHKINHADIKEWAKNYDGELFDGILCDPPYEISFMSKTWDGSGIAHDVEMWKSIYDLLKPGAHLLAFSGSRTYHRMAVAIEDAGFEIRDMVEWVYGSGFPKSLNIGKAVDKINGEDGRPLKFVEWYRTTGMKQKQTNDIIGKADVGSHYLRKDQPVIPTAELWNILRPHILVEIPQWVDELVERIERERELIGKHESDMGGLGGERLGQKGGDITKGTSEWEGYGTALKPAHEPCVLARKPLDKGMTVAGNVLKHGTGGLNIDGTRVGVSDEQYAKNSNRDNVKSHWGNSEGGASVQANTFGRFPANLIHDGSDEVEAVFPQTKNTMGQNKNAHRGEKSSFGLSAPIEYQSYYGESGSASRFFYTAKSSKRERNAGLEGLPEDIGVGNYMSDAKWINDPRHKDGGYLAAPGKPQANHHPTVKPLSLTKYLATLIKPPTGGRLLVPFSGSGSEMIGALQAGWEYVEGVELTEEYIPIAEARIKYWLEQKQEEESKPQQVALV